MIINSYRFQEEYVSYCKIVFTFLSCGHARATVSEVNYILHLSFLTFMCKHALNQILNFSILYLQQFVAETLHL